MLPYLAAIKEFQDRLEHSVRLTDERPAHFLEQAQSRETEVEIERALQAVREVPRSRTAVDHRDPTLPLNI